MLGNVFDIKHFAVFDGPGIRTTLFLKGCSLKCVWCHNPESISPEKQLSYNADKCVSCGKCVSVCKNKAHTFSDDYKHIFVRDNCTFCGKCVSVCNSKLLNIYGKMTDSEIIIKELLNDKDFYDCSNGGITISGGECLLQPDFCREILKEMKKAGIHTAIDTCGFVNRESIEKVLPFTDLFLFDIKAIDENVHIKCTGHSNKQILKNLKYIDSKNKPFEIRIPYIPNYNYDQIEKIGAFLEKLKSITKVRVLPYHNFAKTKYESLDMENTLPKVLPTDEEIENAKTVLKKHGLTIAE